MKAGDALDVAKVAGLVVAVGVIAWLGVKAARAAATAGQAIGESINDGIRVVGQAPANTVLAIGDGLGVPRTDETECDRARREGRTWDASFACDAGTFLRYVWS
ncbi:MAG: hypothetical protein ACOYLX_00810 [Burkholderiaceae bacterium]